jgi:hypothetical protein
MRKDPACAQFNPEDPVIQIGYHVEEWVSRVQKLLALHRMHLVDRSDIWVVEIPDSGNVHACVASPGYVLGEVEKRA